MIGKLDNPALQVEQSATHSIKCLLACGGADGGTAAQNCPALQPRRFRPPTPDARRRRACVRPTTSLETSRDALDPDDFTDHQAVTAIARITRGNSRLRDRLFIQIDRVSRINDFNTITEHVIEAAWSTLIIGTPE